MSSKVRQPRKSKRVAGSSTVTIRQQHPGVPRPIGIAANAPIFEPSTRRATLRYVESLTLTGTSGALGNYVFSANGLYDPNITGTGHQPMGFDQLIGLYNRAYTTSSRVKVDAYQTTGVPAIVGLILTTQSGAPYNNYQTLLESGLATYEVSAADTTDIQHVSRTLNVEKFFSLENVLEEDEYFSTSSANPTRQAYYQIFVQDQNSTSTATFQVIVTIDYDVIFTSPQLQTAS